MQLSASRNPPPVPFSPPSSSPNAGPRAQNRLSGEMRNRAPSLPVPSGTPSLQNGHSRNISGFDMAARSPPNQSSKSFRVIFLLQSFISYRAREVQEGAKS